MDDVGVEMAGAGRPCREHRHPSLERLERTESQRGGYRAFRLAADRDDEIGDEPPIGVEVRAEVVARADHEHTTVGRDRRDRRAAAVEDDDVGAALHGEARTFVHIRHERLPGEPAAGTAAADGDDAGHGRDLEVVGGGVAAGACEGDELLDARRRRDRLGLGRSATTHRHDDDVPVAGEKPRKVRRDRCLANSLSGSDHGDRGRIDLPIGRGVESEVGSDV